LVLFAGTSLGLLCHFRLKAILDWHDEAGQARQQQAQPLPKGAFDDWIQNSKRPSDWMHGS
jgi:hypothetical protein